MKINFLTAVLFLSAGSLFSQSTAPVSMEVPKFVPKSAPVPKYLLCRHFLGMVSDLDNKATAAGQTDPYAFAQPFARARLENADLDALRKEAKALESDLAAHNVKRKAAIVVFRQRAQAALKQGQPMPPLPPEISQLSAMRTALMVNHMANLKATLGAEKAARLDAYLEREFAPHVSLKVLAHPPAALQAQSAPAQ